MNVFSGVEVVLFISMLFVVVVVVVTGEEESMTESMRLQLHCYCLWYGEDLISGGGKN